MRYSVAVGILALLVGHLQLVNCAEKTIKNGSIIIKPETKINQPEVAIKNKNTAPQTQKSIKTNNPNKLAPSYRYEKELIVQEESKEQEPIVYYEPVPNTTGLSDEELANIAEQLKNPMSEFSVKAKSTLIKAGTDGVIQTLKLLNCGNRLATIKAILVIREVGDIKYAPKLVPLLSSKQLAIRYHANLALTTLYKRNFGFHHNARIQDRNKSIAKWNAYIATVKINEKEDEDGEEIKK